MTKQILTDTFGRRVATIETQHDGQQIIIDSFGRRLGKYDPRTNRTMDSSGRPVGHGNLLTSLIEIDNTSPEPYRPSQAAFNKLNNRKSTAANTNTNDAASSGAFGIFALIVIGLAIFINSPGLLLNWMFNHLTNQPAESFGTLMTSQSTWIISGCVWVGIIIAVIFTRRAQRRAQTQQLEVDAEFSRNKINHDTYSSGDEASDDDDDENTYEEITLSGEIAAKLEKAMKVLEVAEPLTYEAAKQAYFDLSKVWHPDKYPQDSRLWQKANEKCKEINAAWAVIEEYYATQH